MSNYCGWILLCLAVVFVQHGGSGIICYHCHQTSKECNNGYLDDKHQKNCSEERCAVMKYETLMPGRKVLATIRDCSSYTKHELLERVSSEKKNPTKIVHFEECETPLCNSGTHIMYTNFSTNYCAKIVIISLLLLIR